MTFNTPVEAAADAQCGRVVHTDIHVKAAPAAPGESKDKSDPGTGGTPFPTGCTSVTLSAQEKALEFLFFDLSACVQPDTDRPVPPPVPPPGAPSTPPGVTPVAAADPPPPPAAAAAADPVATGRAAGVTMARLRRYGERLGKWLVCGGSCAARWLRSSSPAARRRRAMR